MFRRIARGCQHTLTLLRALASPSSRKLLLRLINFSRSLPRQFDRPLPTMMAHLTPVPAERHDLDEDTIRQLADAVAAWHLRSPLGICLRRSLLRYHFLREANIPVKIIFGARLKTAREGDGIGGHAWLTLNDLPYYENPGDYEGFIEMYRYPGEEQPAPRTPVNQRSSKIQNPKSKIQNPNVWH